MVIAAADAVTVPTSHAAGAARRHGRRPVQRRLLFAAIAVLGFAWGELTCGPDNVSPGAAFAEGARAVWIQCRIRLAPLLNPL